MKFSAFSAILGLAIIGPVRTAEHCYPNEDNACHGMQVGKQTGSYSRVARAAAIYGPVDPTTTLPASKSNAVMTAAAVTSGASDEVSDEASDGDVAIANRAIIAHGTIMAFTFVIMFPLGALLIRVTSAKGLVWVHAAVQGFGYILAFTGLGLGIYIAMVPTFQLNLYHPIIGIVVISLLVFQPVIGLLHHRMYRTSSSPTSWSILHVWLGRLIITLGIINGGLGLRLSADTTNGEIIYGVFAGLIWFVWVGLTLWRNMGKRADGN